MSEEDQTETAMQILKNIDKTALSDSVDSDVSEDTKDLVRSLIVQGIKYSDNEKIGYGRYVFKQKPENSLETSSVSPLAPVLKDFKCTPMSYYVKMCQISKGSSCMQTADTPSCW